MKMTLNTKRAALLLSILIISHLFQANSASFQPQKGRSRMLRTLKSPPPAPELGRAPISMFLTPPPPSTVTIRTITRVLRTIRKGAPPAPKLGKARNFRGFLPSPPPPPPPPPPPTPTPPPSPPVYRRPSKCKIPPPPPAST